MATCPVGYAGAWPLLALHPVPDLLLGPGALFLLVQQHGQHPVERLGDRDRDPRPDAGPDRRTVRPLSGGPRAALVRRPLPAVPTPPGPPRAGCGCRPSPGGGWAASLGPASPRSA